MYINWVLKSRNPRISNLVQKNRRNNYFSSRTKLEVTGCGRKFRVIHDLQIPLDVKSRAYIRS